jgi:hypothetical protein
VIQAIATHLIAISFGACIGLLVFALLQMTRDD